LEKNAAVVTMDELRNIRNETEKKPTRTAAMLSAPDIDRMKKATVVQDK
jgi:hypothetical protein